jgi:hypothetical protein
LEEAGVPYFFGLSGNSIFAITEAESVAEPRVFLAQLTGH